MLVVSAILKRRGEVTRERLATSIRSCRADGLGCIVVDHHTVRKTRLQDIPIQDNLAQSCGSNNPTSFHPIGMLHSLGMNKCNQNSLSIVNYTIFHVVAVGSYLDYLLKCHTLNHR